MPEQVAAAIKPINTGEIHLWQLLLSDDRQVSENWLDPEELTRFKNFSGSVQARRYLVSRCALRQILANQLGTAPQELSFSIQPGGKPFIASPECDLQFNLTHTADIGLLAVARGMAVGIDIERIRSLKTRNRIARRIFKPSESRLLEQMPESERDGYFFQLWTSMEARQKCHGSGIFGDKISQRSVGLHQFQPMPGYCAAIAWADPSVHPKLRNYG